MLKIACDFHGVLADLTTMWTAEANRRWSKEWGRTIKPEDVTRWKMWDVTPIKKEQFWEIIDYINYGHLTPLIPPVSGAVKHFPYLAHFYPTEILTAIPHEVVPDITKWLRINHVPQVKVNSIGIAKAAGEMKFNDFDFDIYIDDNPYMVDQTPDDKHLILFDSPWNQHVQTAKPNEHRAYGWEDVVALCHQIQNIL